MNRKSYYIGVFIVWGKIFKKTSILILYVFCSLKSSAQEPVLIEFGWDYPVVDDLYKRLDSMQNTPFNGICFSFQNRITEAFDTVTHKENFFEYDKLKLLKWGKYKNNFIILRGFSKTGGNWFDDNAWVTITKNMNGLSKAMQVGNIGGIFFDPEYYYENQFYNPWTYSKEQYPGMAFEDVKNMVRKRGTEFVAALQKNKVDFSFLSIWLTSLIVEDQKILPLEKTRHALLLPFIEGMVLGKNEKVKIIDGNEYAYGYIKPSQFASSSDYLKKNTVELMAAPKAKQLALNIQTAQPIFYDGLLAKHPSFDKGVDYDSRWKWLEENLKYAIASSTSNIVWFYSQRINWWHDKANDTLVNILENSKSVFNTKKINKPVLIKENNVNSGKGYYYIIDPKKPMNSGDVAFTYFCDIKKKTLLLTYTGKLPLSVSVYINNVLATTANPKAIIQKLKLKKFSKGTLIIQAQYEGRLEASAIQKY